MGGGEGYIKQDLNYLEQGFAVQNYERFKQVEVKTANISIHPFSKGRQGCISDLLDTPKRICVPPFLLIGFVLSKVQPERANLILITPAWQA